jgi:hypothetical protein
MGISVVQLAHFQVWWAACILTIACPQVHVVYNQQFWGTTRAIWRVLFLPGVRGRRPPARVFVLVLGSPEGGWV